MGPTSTTTEKKAHLWRIGEFAKLSGVTTRTLRYWEEFGLLHPSNSGDGGQRLYSSTDLARVTRIRDLQELLGSSLAEVRTVLGAEGVEVLDRVRSELNAGDISASRREALLDEAIVANDELMDRLDETVARIQAFRNERAGTADRLRKARAELKRGKARTT